METDANRSINANRNAEAGIINVEMLSKSFKNAEVLKGISFSVAKGCIFALLGSNGAGKTTTIKILSTLLLPSGGKAAIHGFDIVKDARRVREKISLTGQYAAVDEKLTGRENMHMIGALRHIPGVKKQAAALLAQFGLTDAADRPVSTYSGGMRRKLDLAMSLLGNPAVVFLDEPTTGLDPQSRLSMWKTIQSIAQAGTTVFLTTQYLEEAERLADYIAILDQGHIIAEGTVDELKKILPGGVIAFSFQTEDDMEKAAELLADYPVQQQSDIQTLSVTTDDSLVQLTDMLNLLTAAGITVSRFEKKLPTLEDVFLTLISDGTANTANSYNGKGA